MARNHRNSKKDISSILIKVGNLLFVILVLFMIFDIGKFLPRNLSRVFVGVFGEHYVNTLGEQVVYAVAVFLILFLGIMLLRVRFNYGSFRAKFFLSVCLAGFILYVGWMGAYHFIGGGYIDSTLSVGDTEVGEVICPKGIDKYQYNKTIRCTLESDEIIAYTSVISVSNIHGDVKTFDEQNSIRFHLIPDTDYYYMDLYANFSEGYQRNFSYQGPLVVRTPENAKEEVNKALLYFIAIVVFSFWTIPSIVNKWFDLW